MQPSLDTLEERLGYRFLNREPLVRALTHRSSLSDLGPLPAERSRAESASQGSAKGPDGDNEQLEFLGDSILGFMVSEALVTQHPAVREGQLSQWKAHLVSAAHLYDCALLLDLGPHLRLGKGEERNGGRERKTLLANALEAVIAAIYLDGGLAPVRGFIATHVLSLLSNAEDVQSINLLNHKSVLQERTQAMGLPVPRYTTVGTSGPEHARIFTVEGRIGTQLAARAEGPSKKVASQQAAQRLLEQLDLEASPREVLKSRPVPA